MPDDKSWLPSEAYESIWPADNGAPRTSLLKFGSWGDALRSVGKIIGQSIIAWSLFAMLFIVLVDASSQGDQYYLAVSEIIKLICLTISVFLATRIFDDSNIQDLGLKLNGLAFRDFLVGFGFVSALFGFEFVLESGTRAIVVQSVAWQTMPVSDVLWNMLILLVIFLFVGWSEELLSRGFHLRILSKGLNRPLGILLSAGIFSYLHHDNPDMTTSSYIFVFFAGLVFSAAFLRSGNLWLPMGLHAGWDFFVAVFWGAPISGLRLFHLMDIRVSSGVALIGLPRVFLQLGVLTALVYYYTRGRKLERRDW